MSTRTRRTARRLAPRCLSAALGLCALVFLTGCSTLGGLRQLPPAEVRTYEAPSPEELADCLVSQHGTEGRFLMITAEVRPTGRAIPGRLVELMGAAVAPLMGAQPTWTLLLVAEPPARVRVEFREEPKIAGSPTLNHRIWQAVEDCAGPRVANAPVPATVR